MSLALAAQPFPSSKILGLRVHAVTYDEVVGQVRGWVKAGEGRAIGVANVHVTMEAYDDPALQASLNDFDLVVPDGMPLVWVLRRRGFPLPDRVYGPELTLRLCALAEEDGFPVGFLGGTPEVLEALVERLKARFPTLRVGFSHSPPFSQGALPHDPEMLRAIVESGVGILFVGLGCPKQERWVARHRKELPAVLLGVGAAFDFHAGRVSQAPGWMQRAGLEWSYRLAREPRRLWRRYLVQNPRFLWKLLTG
ncbi:MAG: WecB/TagA/CpsF family glycosyltransferase [Gemmatimonadota bacterium]